MRICLVCSEYPPGPHGGIGTFTQVLARGMQAAGHQVRVVGVYPESYPASDYEEDAGVKVYRFRDPGRPFNWLRKRWLLYRQIKQWCRSGRCDVVEVPDWAGWAAGWPKLPVPLVARLNGSASYFAVEIGDAVKRRIYWLERASLRRADFWCSVSKYTGEKTKRLFGLKTGPDAILYNPVEALGGDEQSRGDNKIVFTGTLTEKKGVIPLMDAWDIAAQKVPHAELHVYGKDCPRRDGESMQQYLTSRLGEDARRRIHFHGHQPRERIFDALRSARLAVFPSYAEAFALAPLEAMSCGCPTISSNRGAGNELLRDGADGLLVDPDRPDQIADAMVRLLTDDTLALRMGDAGRQRVLNAFTIDRLREQNEQFYAECIDRFSRAI